MNTNRLIESRSRLQVAKMEPFPGHLCAASERLAGGMDPDLGRAYGSFIRSSIRIAK